jgi:Holliday junction resolvase-like predicted endonuclease
MELCRQLQPVLGKKVDRLWRVYLTESDPQNRAELEQTLELLAQKHLAKSYQIDLNPFPPPSKSFAQSGGLELGQVFYAGKEVYPFRLQANRLKEHLLVAGRSGSGKTNLTFVLMDALIAADIKVLALDWKRGYRDLGQRHSGLRVFTVGRKVAPFFFNPLIPPASCEPRVWIKLIVDVIADSYLGGEGVISLLVHGLDKLYRDCGVFDHHVTRWPTIEDLLLWLQQSKLKGRAALWKASAERILLSMSYGEFGQVMNTQHNNCVPDLLDRNVVLELDGLSSKSDRKLFSEALTLYLYRYRLAQGPSDTLTNMIILEEAHHLLLKKSLDAQESMLENSIRMIRQYGLGYIFVDQSASKLSQVAFANSYATMALSQKLKGDIQALAAAMNLSDEQKEALTALPIGSAVVRLADEYPYPFLVKIPLCPIKEGLISDRDVKNQWLRYYGDSTAHNLASDNAKAIPAIPAPDNNNKENNGITHPPPYKDNQDNSSIKDISTPPLSSETKRFLVDLVNHPLSTTVSRYQRLNLSRRKGNAIRQQLLELQFVAPVPLATRSGQVVLYQLTDWGRTCCESTGLDPGPKPIESLEHRYWVQQVAATYEKQGYTITREYPVKGNGAIDLVAEKPGEKVAIEVETGKSNIPENLKNAVKADMNSIVLLATSATAVTACQKALDACNLPDKASAKLLTWLDMD